MQKCMLLCFHVNFKYESTRTCMFHVKFLFSAYFYPHYIIMVKGLYIGVQSLVTGTCMGMIFQVTRRAGVILISLIPTLFSKSLGMRLGGIGSGNEARVV